MDPVVPGLFSFPIVVDAPPTPADAFQVWLREVRLGSGFPFRIELVTAGGVLTARTRCMDRQGYRDVTINFDYRIPPDVTDRPAFLRYVRWVLHQVVCHEVDEFLLVGGYPEFDPHRDARPGYSDPAYDWRPSAVTAVPVTP